MNRTTHWYVVTDWIRGKRAWRVVGRYHDAEGEPRFSDLRKANGDVRTWDNPEAAERACAKANRP